jgi:L-ascorbate metabolism protein UlaG (beta-lactamase superfamily)
MRIRHFLYNAFLIECGKIKIAIDPGQNLWIFNLTSLIPKEDWKSITHIFVTHGDPDHYWQADRVARAACAPLILNKTMVKQTEGKTLILGPRSRGIQFIPYSGKVIPLDINEYTHIDGIQAGGIGTVHGPIELKILGLKKRETPGPKERVGFGSIGFKIELSNKSIVNLGDSVLQKEWVGLNPDVLMLPIGGLGDHTWTMDLNEAIEAVKIISPKLVIPCHYSVPFFWKKIMAPADDQKFKQEVEKLGVKCKIMKYGDEIEV